MHSSPPPKGDPPTHTHWEGRPSPGRASPRTPIPANLGHRDEVITACRLGHQGGKGPGAPSPCTRSPGWPGCPEAVNRLHSSWNGMEMRLPDRGALSWGRRAASSWAWRGSPPPALPTLRCPPGAHPAREHCGQQRLAGVRPPRIVGDPLCHGHFIRCQLCVGTHARNKNASRSGSSHSLDVR